MGRWQLLLIGAVGLCVLWHAKSAAELSERPPILRYAGSKLMSGQWTYNIMRGPSMRVLVEDAVITGFGFSLSSAEIACCTAATGTQRSSVWLISVPPPEMRSKGLEWTTDTPRRLFWTAAEDVAVSGPVWWAPGGGHVAVRIQAEGANDLVVLDYVTGHPTWLTRGANIVAAAWSPRADRIAYVTEQDDHRELWIQTFPPTTARRIGESGIGLRWSPARTPEEDRLSWFSPRADAVWDRLEWTSGAGEAVHVGTVPARPAGAMWSPDGTLCAALQPAGEADEKKLVFYRTNSAVGEELSLPDVDPERLLCWSPDGRLVLVAADIGAVLAVGAQPVSGYAKVSAEESGEGVPQRIGFVAISCDVEAGYPSWTAAGDMIAYVMGREGETMPIMVSPGERFPFGDLIVAGVDRQFVEAPEGWEEEVVLKNMKLIAFALQMYLADNEDILPSTADMDTLHEALGGYVGNRPVFMGPGGDEETVVKYVAPPRVHMACLDDPTTMPIAVADYAPGFFTIAYADGHAESFERTPANAEALAAWWQALDLLRDEDVAAQPPPFPLPQPGDGVTP